MCLGVPGKVTEIIGSDLLRMAKVDFGGVVKDVSLSYLPEVGVGDWVIVHVGFAITQLDERAAQDTLDTLAAMGDLPT